MILFVQLNNNKIDGLPCHGILLYEDDSHEFDGAHLKFDEYLLKIHADDKHVWMSDYQNSRADILTITSDEFHSIKSQFRRGRKSEKIIENNVVNITVEEVYEIEDIDSFFRIGDSFVWLHPSNAEIRWLKLDNVQSNGLAKYLDQWLSYKINEDSDEDEFKKTQDFDIYFKGKGLGNVKGIRVVGRTSKTLQVNDEDLNDCVLGEHLFDVLRPIIEGEDRKSVV